MLCRLATKFPCFSRFATTCDAVVATKPEIQEVISDEKTKSVINTNTIPVADFVTDRNLDFRSDHVVKVIEKTTQSIESELPAIKIAEYLTGDAIGANMVMLGAAYQKDWCLCHLSL